MIFNFYNIYIFRLDLLVKLAAAATRPNPLSTHKHPAMYILAQACVLKGCQTCGICGWQSGRQGGREGGMEKGKRRGGTWEEGGKVLTLTPSLCAANTGTN